MRSIAIIFSLLFLVTFLSRCTRLREDQPGYKPQNIAALLGADEWVAPDSLTIHKEKDAALILYGKELIVNTGKYYGPKGIVSKRENGMNCQNCHLKAGTQLYANSFSAVYSIYPKIRARSGTVENLYKRINDCMERSLGGHTIDTNSREMLAMTAYINWVGKDVKKGVSPKGAAVEDLPYMERAADPELGKVVYEKHCVTCHGADGRGKFNDDSITYLYPPLWGDSSYTTAAGMYRLSRLAGFVKSNMPDLKSSHDNPTLSDEESWDVAAYINNLPRKEKKFKGDWPDIAKKPVDHPFGPFADRFDERQHKFGPFKEIPKPKK